ncbi:MAG: dienelactone hydrolase family protein [Gammaproteobacteria bacterium]|nr:dienelactone hydrolase family protein [Gammaproteobacteria bacterium]
MPNTLIYQDGEQKLVSQLFCDPKAQGQLPGVIVFPAFEGLSEFAIDYAKKIAEQGYAVLAADVYGDGVVEKTIDGCYAKLKPFLEDPALVRRRACLAFDALSSQDNVDSSRIGAIGFCFGGKCALEIARSGADIKAVVSAHGVLPKSDLANQGFKASILILHGYKDPMVPPEVLNTFAEEMQQEKVDDWRFVFFGNGKHSFTDPATGTFEPAREAEMGREYNRTAAKATYRYALDFFNEILN